MRTLLVGIVLSATAGAAAACEAGILFQCATDEADRSGLRLCSDGDTLLDPANEAMLEIDHADGTRTTVPAAGAAPARDIAFAHSTGADGYLVTLRFPHEGGDYLLFSLAVPPSGEPDDVGGGDAGLARFASDGVPERVATCAEVPEIFISTLRSSVACDGETPLGAAACTEIGALRQAPLPAHPAVPWPATP